MTSPTPDPPATDRVFAGFLDRQAEIAQELSAESPLLEVHRRSAHVLEAVYRCRGVLLDPQARELRVGAPDRWIDLPTGESFDGFAVRITLRPDYLRREPDPFQVLSWLGPLNVVHPNINALFGKICIGPVAIGTPVDDLIYRCWEVITFRNVNTNEDDCMNPSVCDWARENLSSFPVDDRPLKGPMSTFDVELIEQASES